METLLRSEEIGRKPRHSQGRPKSYDHSKPSQFPQFIGLLEAKLVFDGPAIGTEEEKV
jgi:hypothetical protein